MTKPFSLLLFFLFFLVGCDSINKVLNSNITFLPYSPNQANHTINQSNVTIINLTQPDTSQNKAFNLTIASKYIFIASSTSLLVHDNYDYIIDAPKTNLNILNLIATLNITSIRFIVSTINKEEHNGGIPYLVTRAHPSMLYDNGVNDLYRETYLSRLEKFNSYWNLTKTDINTLLEDTSQDSFDFIVPYHLGLSSIKEENSIVVSYEDKILYMSDCYGVCEEKMPPLKTKYLLLANGGACPTNSFDFVISTGAHYIIGDEICPILSDEIGFIGITPIILNGRTVQIIFHENGDEIIYG